MKTTSKTRLCLLLVIAAFTASLSGCLPPAAGPAVGQPVDVIAGAPDLPEHEYAPPGNGLPEDTGPEVAAGGLPVGKLVLMQSRKEYKDESLTIYIPAIDVSCPVYDGTDDATLGKMGACLYDYAQLPGAGNRNTSLAAHRNGRVNGRVNDRAPFYYIDLLAEGDYIYLYDEEMIYRYVWEYCEIVAIDDWEAIRTVDYSCVTLTSCHPIGISTERIVVRGRLDMVIPYNGDYGFPASSGAA